MTTAIIITALFLAMSLVFIMIDDSVTEKSLVSKRENKEMEVRNEELNNEEELENEDNGKEDNEDPVNVLAKLMWPRRDNSWYRQRWSREECPFKNCHGKPIINDIDDNHQISNYESYVWGRQPPDMPQLSEKIIKDAFAYGQQELQAKQELEKSLKGRRKVFQNVHNPHRRRLDLLGDSDLTNKMSQQGFLMNMASAKIKEHLNLSNRDLIVDGFRLVGEKTSPMCNTFSKTISPEDCNPNDKFRTADGTCNNLDNPQWGTSFMPFTRGLPQEYEDGVSSIRLAKDNSTLPSPRLVSRVVHSDSRLRDSSFHSHLAMTWGQFLDHDITGTPLSKDSEGNTISCCIETSNSISLPTEETHPECLPIEIPDGDPFYSERNVSCMNFIRSAPSPMCTFGGREQFSEVTSFIDGSMLYGSTQMQMNQFRMYEGGKIEMQDVDGRELLPPRLSPNDTCNKHNLMNIGRYCFKSGDKRVNEHVLLTIIHTVFARHHNNIASRLELLNPQWDDERIFQETRKIVGAEIQHITTREYLPVILGRKLSSRLGLLPSRKRRPDYVYNSTINAGVANEFATAAFRFGHSMIQGSIQSIDPISHETTSQQLKKTLFFPFNLYDPYVMTSFINGEVTQASSDADASFTTQVTQHLFEDLTDDGGEVTPNLGGLDLASLNIQRGRDHGLASYHKWRQYCGLEVPNKFKGFKSILQNYPFHKIKQVYTDYEDIDLFTGGLSEPKIKAKAAVGPTFACLIADQFFKLKFGDRFWYESKGYPQSFTKGQLKQLYTSSLSAVFCDTFESEGLTTIPRRPMKLVNEKNPDLLCDSIPRLNLNKWKEN